MTLPIKILCACGQKYAFDAEILDGRLAHPVQCPVCGSDGTPVADQIVAEQLEAHPAPTAGLSLARENFATPVIPLPRRIPTEIIRDGNSIETKRRKKMPILALAGVALFILIVVGVGMHGASPNRKTVASVPSNPGLRGLPQTLAELNAWYVEPLAGQNAATFNMQGFEALQLGNADSIPILGKAQTPLPPVGTPIPASMNSNLGSFLKSNQPALQLFARGAKLEYCRYPVNLMLGLDALFPHAKKLDIASSVLELAAVYHAGANRGDEAANDVLTGLALANSATLEPALLTQLARSWSVGYTVAALEQTVNRTVLSGEATGQLASAFRKMEAREAAGEGFGRAMVGARAIGLAALAHPNQLLQGMQAPDLKMPAERRRQITTRLEKGDELTAERDFFEASFQRLMIARQEPFPARLKSDDLGRQLVAEATEKKLFVLDLLLPSLGRRTTVEAECLAQLRLGMTAVALEQFRAAHGNRYPRELSELTPEFLSAVPADPFDGQSLRFQTEGKGYLLYSIGPDLVDNSGRRKSGKEGDIVFVVLAP